MNRLTPSITWIACVTICANIIGGYHFTPVVSQIASCIAACGTALIVYLGKQTIPPAELLKAQSKLTIK